MKKLMMLCMSLMMCLSLVACGSGSNEVEYKIGLVQLMDHASLNTIKDAIIEQLEKDGYVDGENVTIDYQNAGGDMSTLDTICKQYAANEVDVIIAITTPAAQAAAPYAEDIPVIFSAVSDVKASGLVKNMEKPDLNITGTSDEIQVSSIMDLAKEMYPDTKTIGYLYNSGEANSVANLDKLQSYADENGLTVQTAAITNASDISTGLASLLESSDIVFSPTDNTVASAMAQVSEMCNNAKVPFFTGADSMVQDGGFATYGINYESLGHETAKMAIKVLTGTKIEAIPVKVFKDDLKLYINTTTAEKLGYNDIDTLKEKYDVVTFE